MSPLISRRRSRRRSASGRIVVLIGVLIVIAVLVGGLTQVSRQSGAFDASANRSFAAQGSVLAAESNVTGTAVRRLIATMPTEARPTLQSGLDSAVLQSSQQSAQAESLARPSVPGRVAMQFATVFRERAEAVRQIRAALDGLFGMASLPVAGTSSHRVRVVAGTLLTSSVAINRIAGDGELLAESDHLYRETRHALAKSAGHAKLPASVWVTVPAKWQLDSVSTQVNLAATSPTLAVVHDLEIGTVRLFPEALPPAPGVTSPGLSVLSPTSKVQVTVVISNAGTVVEPHASVQFALTRQPSGLTRTVTRAATVAAGQSVTLTQVTFVVKPGTTYRLSVSVVLPPAQTQTTATTLTHLLRIAPST